MRAQSGRWADLASMCMVATPRLTGAYMQCACVPSLRARALANGRDAYIYKHIYRSNMEGGMRELIRRTCVYVHMQVWFACVGEAGGRYEMHVRLF